METKKKIKKIPPLSKKVIDRFWSKVTPIDNPFLCWNWLGKPEKQGYATLHLKEGIFKAHRLSYTINFGEIPEGLIVCHKCDNRMCVNPNHFFIGTEQDNCKDKEAKGRGNPVIGENHWAVRNPEKVKRGETSGTSKLNNEIVLSIRELSKNFTTKMECYSALSKKFNISQTTIRRVIKRQGWRHL